MATVTIDASNPSTTVNLAVLKSALDKLLDAADVNSYDLAPDEYILINELRYATTTGIGGANVISAITITY